MIMRENYEGKAVVSTSRHFSVRHMLWGVMLWGTCCEASFLISASRRDASCCELWENYEEWYISQSVCHCNVYLRCQRLQCRCQESMPADSQNPLAVRIERTTHWADNSRKLKLLWRASPRHDYERNVKKLSVCDSHDVQYWISLRRGPNQRRF